jgi:CNT family concentrative nucleoside transporter
MSTPASPAQPAAVWRLGLAAVVAGLAAAAYWGSDALGPRVRSGMGVVAFVGFAFVLSRNLRAVNPRVVAAGFGLQLTLAALIIHAEPVRRAFDEAGRLVALFVGFSTAGAGLLFDPLASQEAMAGAFGPRGGVPFAIVLTATVIFVSTVFSVLYHYRILQAVVWVFARLMVLLMGRRGVSGAESLSAAANVFMGQTEAPLIVRPYVRHMTESELLAIMVGGMATIAGGVMAIYIQMGADARAVLATSVMAAPCGLYVAKILVPETGEPRTRGKVSLSADRLDDRPGGPGPADPPAPANVVDAAAAGASDGMRLAINIIAMLLAFLAVIAAVNYGLGRIHPGWSLEAAFARLFGPVAALLGVAPADVPKVAELLGIKLVANEFVAFQQMTGAYRDPAAGGVVGMDPRSYALATYALTGFANIGSIGIQLGGIGAMAENRRADLARLGVRALAGGFLATLINASVAGVLM